MPPEPETYQPLNVPTTGPVDITPQSPPPPPVSTGPTSTDRHMRRLFTKTWFLIIIGLVLVIAFMRLYTLYA